MKRHSHWSCYVKDLRILHSHRQRLLGHPSTLLGWEPWEAIKAKETLGSPLENVNLTKLGNKNKMKSREKKVKGYKYLRRVFRFCVVGPKTTNQEKANVKRSQWEFKAKAWKLFAERKGLSNQVAIGFIFASDWEFYWPITEQSNNTGLLSMLNKR